MEEDEMEMTKEELTNWIRAKVKKKTSADLLEKYNLLQSILEKKQNQAAHFLKLCESVAACEAIVKKQYSLLGLEYRDSDSDDDDDSITGCGNTPPSPHELVHCSSETTNGNTPLSTKLKDRGKLYRYNGKNVFINLKRRPVVVLARLSPCKIRSLCPPKPQNRDNEDESVHNSDSDNLWEPDDDASESDFSISSYNSGSNKRRKVDHKDEKPAKSHATPQASKDTGAKGNATETSAPQANASAIAESNTVKTPTPPANTKGIKPELGVSAPSQSSGKATKTQGHSSVPERKICVNLNVLARRRPLDWQKGTIMEIVEKEDGRLKYKINFQEKGKSLVSGHHIAFDSMPKVEELFVGARVVVNRKGKKPQFCPGVLAEIPSRRNRMRFLVLMDDHTPVYAGLPLLHLVCKPLADPCDDIPDETHKNFMKGYVQDWPYPPMTQYRVGQTLNAEVDGVQQRCEVLKNDSSLIEVVFQKDQRIEWIYRGSMRLEHMIKMKQHLDMKRGEGQKNRSATVNESSKAAQ